MGLLDEEAVEAVEDDLSATELTMDDEAGPLAPSEAGTPLLLEEEEAELDRMELEGVLLEMPLFEPEARLPVSPFALARIPLTLVS